MKISVVGLGMVSKIGNIKDLERMLTQSMVDPRTLSTTHTLPISIPDDFGVSQSLIRRMSHFAKLSLLSVYDALKDSSFDIAGKSIGIIQGSVYGPIISGIQAFDELIDFGDNQLSPTNFSGSVFNTAATYLSLALGIQGCTLTHTCGLDTLYNSFLSASLWLESGVVDYVIMGIGDEYTPYFDESFLKTDQKTGLLPTCEGWTTFILGKDENAKYGSVKYGHLNQLSDTQGGKSIYSIWHEQIGTEGLLNYVRDNQACFPVHLRGSYPSGLAFDLALALLCKKNGKFPVFNDNNGQYQIHSLNPNERITCYNRTESNDLAYYRIIND